MTGDAALARWIERRPENLARYLGLRVAPFHQEFYGAALTNRALLVLMARGVGKTWCQAVLAAWFGISRPENRDPAIGELFPGAPEPIGPHNVAMLIGAHTREHAWEVLDLVRQFFKKLEPVYGMLEKRGTRSELDTVLRAAVRKEPTIRALGRDSRWAGSHYDLHLVDDAVTKEVARSPALTRKLESDFANDISPTRRPYGRSIWSGTRWGATDLYSTLIRRTAEGTWDSVLRFAALAEAHGTIHSIDPRVYSVAYLDKIRRDSPAAFEAQYQNAIQLVGGSTFFSPELFDPERCVDFAQLSSQARQRASTYIALDPSVGDDPARNDASAFVVVTAIPSVPPLIIIRHVERGHWKQTEIIECATKLATRFAPRTFVVEAQGGFALLADEVQRALRKLDRRIRFDAVRGTGKFSKPARAERARALFDKGLVKLVEATEENGLDRLVWEMTSFNPLRTRHEPGADDCVDALGWALLAISRPTTRVL